MKSERRRFRDTALASELIDEPQLAAAESEVAVVMNRATTDPVEWDKAVADRLVQQGLLTTFQVREMLAGRRRFRLGQYTVLDEIGKGGMGQVFRAEHAMMGREVAVKVLPRAKSTPESEAAFRREMRMLGRLDHENLVRAFDAGYDAQVYYLVTELVPGLDLKQQVVKYGALEAAAAASVVSQAAQGLSYAHEKGLVHRDVKPGNILVMPDGRAKVLDLGLAGSTLEAESSRLGRVVGTMDYIAPEQIRMPDDVGPSADIYALGCTLYFAVTGRVPFPGGSRREKMHRHLHDTPEPVRKLAGHVGEDFCRLIEAMMVKVPANRIATASEVVERLRPWTGGGPMPMSRTPQPATAAALPHSADGAGVGP
ncbi:MAG: serine/threonine protein kinase, partial [Planctomycetia bacterium]|nr:serine/threonine protein kinase [Planctomycetia bacterium]